jgi:hypothetical protein
MKTLALLLSVCRPHRLFRSPTACGCRCASRRGRSRRNARPGRRTGRGHQPAPATPATPADSAKVEADYLGRWTGVEGMYLVVAAKPGGGVTLDMQWDLDNKGMFDGSVTAEGLRFMRNGVAETALHTNGDATGLKYLAGKQDCLTVKPGEGYCRD